MGLVERMRFNMRRAIALAITTASLAGCQALKDTADLAAKPPVEILERIKEIFLWFGSLFIPFFNSLFFEIFG